MANTNNFDETNIHLDLDPINLELNHLESKNQAKKRMQYGIILSKMKLEKLVIHLAHVYTVVRLRIEAEFQI